MSQPLTRVTTAADIAAIGTDSGIVAFGASHEEQHPACLVGAASLPLSCDPGAIGLAAWGQTFYEDYIQSAGKVETSTLTGNRGSVLRLELYWTPEDWPRGAAPSNLFGAAQDGNGNLYKIEW